MRTLWMFMVVFAGLAVIPPCCEGDIVVSSGAADFASTHGAVRWRSFGNTGSDEMYLGSGDLGNGSNRVSQQTTWTNPGSNAVSFFYDADTNLLGASIGNQTPLSWLISDPGTLDTLQIGVADRTAGAPLLFNNVMLNGDSLGDFGGTGDWAFWTVSGFDFSQDWVLTGDILLSGPFTGSQELSKIDLVVGVAAIPEPGSGLVVMLGSLWILVRLRRTAAC